MSDSTETRISGRYILQQKLGEGGMGVVYRATDRLTQETVALKRVTVPGEKLQFAAQGSMGHSDDFRLALAQEFKTLASLRHPHIISVLDYGFDALHQPFFTMELLADAPNLIEAGRNLPRAKQIQLLVPILQALAYLHRRGIIHRDLKPDNVLVIEGQVKVLDFGLAVARAHVAAENRDIYGTPSYMAPEVFEGRSASEASDLYAVGLMAFELFAGRHPFDTTNLAMLMMDIMKTVPDTHSLGLDEQLAQMLDKLLAKNPRARYSDARELINLLAGVANQPDLVIETGAIRESYLQAADFIGREAELGQLVEALAAAKGGQGSAWLVGGESGVGKSRLMDELRSQALVDGALVLQGQAVSEKVRPYRIWSEVFRRLCLESDLSDLEAGVLKVLVPDIGRLLTRHVPDAPQATPQAAFERLLDIMAEVVQRHKQPLVIILEDLQWVGDESLAVLERLGQGIDKVPVLLLASYRDDERPRLAQELPQMQQLKLPRLSTNSITALSASMLGTAGRQPALINLLEQETEGNTFFIIEVVRVLAEEAGQLDQIGELSLPRTVFAGGMKAVVERRLAQVPATAYPLLQLTAIAGRQIDIRLLSGLEPGMNVAVWLGNCAEVRVLEVHQGRWRFAHDKLREGLLLDLQADERRHLHRQVAEAIEQVYAADLSPLYPRLAYHWSRVVDADDGGHDLVKIDRANLGLVSKAIDYLHKAGEQARDSYANREAIDYFRQALTILEGASAAEQLQDWGFELTLHLREGLGDLLELIGKYGSARTAYQDTVDKVPQGDRLRSSRLHRKHGNTWVSQHQYEAALEEFDKAQNSLGQRPAEVWPEWWQEWVQVQVERMWVHYYLAQVGEMTNLAEKIRPVVEQYGTPATRVKFFDCLIARNNRRDRYVVSEETLVYARAQLAAKQELGILDDIAHGRFLLGFSLLWSGKLAEAEDQMQAALTLLEQSGHSYMQMLCLTYLTVIYRKLGQVEQVEFYNAQGLTAALAGQQLNYIGVANANLAWLAWHEGNLVEVEQNGLAALELWKQTSRVYPFQWLALWPLIAAALAQNRLSKAVEFTSSLVEPAQQLIPDTLTAEVEGAIAAWKAGKPNLVNTHLNQAIALAQDLGFL